MTEKIEKLRKIKGKKQLLKIIPMIIISLGLIIAMFLAMRNNENITIKSVLRLSEENPLIIKIVLWIFFGLKSITLVFPMAVFLIASGIFFKPLTAILVSLVGYAITITIPYLLGRKFGTTLMDSLWELYPKLKKIENFQTENTFFTTFILRLMSIFPSDIVSSYFGATHTPFLYYLMGSIAGGIVMVTTTTLLGTVVTEPGSKLFIIVLTIRISLALGSIIYKKRSLEKDQ